jgi:hypothetical protein
MNGISNNNETMAITSNQKKKLRKYSFLATDARTAAQKVKGKQTKVKRKRPK